MPFNMPDLIPWDHIALGPIRLKMNLRIVLLIAACCPAASLPSFGAIIDFTSWTVVTDPFDPNFSASATSSSANLLVSGGPIATATDIGFQSVNGATPAISTAGAFFNPANDFSIAIDYSLSFGPTPQGVLGLGFGIGEDSDGTNSAGIGLTTEDGNPFLTLAGAARINDVNQSPLPLSILSTLEGSLFVQYEASSGDVTVGAATIKGASTPGATATYTGIQNQWSEGDLLASFFIRSEGSGWQSGTGEAVFENFRVLNGTVSSVPEPKHTAVALGFVGVAMIWIRRKFGLRPSPRSL